MPTPIIKSPYLRPAEAGEYARVTRSTIYRWMSDGLIKSYCVGGVRLIKVSDIDRLIEKGEEKQ